MKPPLFWILVFRFMEHTTYPLELFLTTRRTICSRRRYDACSCIGKMVLTVFSLVILPLQLLIIGILWPAHLLIRWLEGRYADYLWYRKHIPYMWRWF